MKKPTYFEMSSSCQITCLINGRHATIDTSAAEFQSDIRGIINLNIRAPDLVAPNINIAVSGCRPVAFNPATKAVEKLLHIAGSGKLSEARNPDGKPIFLNADDKTSKAIVDISRKYLEKAGDGPIIHRTESTISTVSSIELAQPDGALWQFWHGICSGIEAIRDFFYEAGVFIVKTAKGVWNFLVDTAEQALSALSGLFRLIETEIEDALVWLAEKLDWESITDVVTILNEAFNMTLNLTRELIVEGDDWIDNIFSEIEGIVGSWRLPPGMPAQLASAKPSLKGEDADKNDIRFSPGFNWITNTMENFQKPNPKITMSSNETEFTDLLKTIFLYEAAGSNVRWTNRCCLVCHSPMERRQNRQHEQNRLNRRGEHSFSCRWMGARKLSQQPLW